MATFEVLTRKPDGHETVHRFAAADAEEAKAQAVEAGVPADQIVEVGRGAWNVGRALIRLAADQRPP